MSLLIPRVSLLARGIDPDAECRPDPARLRALAEAAIRYDLPAIAEAARRAADDLDRNGRQPGATA